MIGSGFLLPVSKGFGHPIAPPTGGGVSIFDLLVNGSRLLVNTQALRTTSNGD